MALAAGARLGPYKIHSGIGAGGMGEVYRATDTNLGRQVAIKVLPEAFAHDSERLACFERGAKTLASVNHRNIAIIHGLEKANGIRALVMELVEGPTLADRIARGPIPVDETLPIARQIAEALEAAHEQGIIHRDLKPANIKVRPDGTVKVLDFGLAKAMEPPSSVNVNTTASPTIASPAMMIIDNIERVIHMNVASHVGAKPTNQGHSIGRFDGDVLVVDTTDFAAHASGVRTGVPSGPGKHLVERFELSPDRTRLTYSYQLEDPEYLTKPVTGSVEWVHRPDLAYTGYKCDREIAGRFLAN